VNFVAPAPGPLGKTGVDPDSAVFGFRDRAVHLTLKACCLVWFAFASAAAAQEPDQGAMQKSAAFVPRDAAPQMKSPRVLLADVDWAAVRAELANSASPAIQAALSGAPTTDAVTRLNEATRKIFPKIDVSPIPVLLPFDTAAFMQDDAAGLAGDKTKYVAGFHASSFNFFPGPAGYDAALSLQPQDNPGLDLTFVKRVDVQISGSAVLYELDVPSASEGAPVPELESQFPGIRRLLAENHVRYTFVHFGVPYFVSLLCDDGPKRARRLSCREADKVGIRFLKALTIVGGAPQAAQANITPQTIDQPEAQSPDFTYYAPGDILPGTGMRGQAGRADPTVYARIRYPMAQAPSYVNSQTFMNWGNCDFTGRVTLGGRAYRCKVNSKPLVRDESKNYAYPWRDNFCEHRYFQVGQCPAGLGHQGEDIRPSSCLLRNEGADRCQPFQHDIVAVRSGVVLRAAGDEALYLVADAPGEHIRFRYLHMDPRTLDAAGMVTGRELTEGEVIGAAANYENHQGGTTYHLHFDLQVPTRAGWVFVNPYMTLVASYERLIGARGQVVRDAMPAAAQAVPNSADISASKAAERDKILAAESQRRAEGHVKTHAQEPHERSSRKAEHCQTRVVKGHRRRHCGIDVAEGRGRSRHHGVRSVGRRFSHESHRARYHDRDVRSRHARRPSRHGRA
jgi:hypothetical protein